MTGERLTQKQQDDIGAVLESIDAGSLGRFKRLSPQGRAYFIRLFESAVGEKDSASLEALYSVDYDRPPPDPHTFITHTDYAAHYGAHMWEAWKRHFIDVCTPASGVCELILTGAMGLGKTNTAMAILAYKICRITHLRDPARFYGLAAGSKIVFGIYAVTKMLVKQVGFFDLRDMIIDHSPYFKEVMPRVPHGKETIKWPQKGIDVLVGSNQLHAIGQNLFAVVADELNYYKQGEKTAIKADTIVSEVSRRLESRFLEASGEVPGIAIYISQTRSTNDFLELRAQDASRRKNVRVVRGSRWEFSPNGYERAAALAKRRPNILSSGRVDTPCGPVQAFRLFVGNELKNPLILDHVVLRSDGVADVHPIVQEKDIADVSKIMMIPVVHHKSFEEDLLGAMRSIADVPTGNFSPFLPQKAFVETMFDKAIPNPFSADCVPCYEQQGVKLQDFFNADAVTNIRMGKRSPKRHPQAPRYIHFDLSETNDRTGMAMVHPSAHYLRDTVTGSLSHMTKDNLAMVGQGEMIKDVEVDFYVALVVGPSGQPIDYQRARSFVDWLRRIGFWIVGITADRHMSFDHLMRLRDMGFKAELQSVDTSSKPYIAFRQLLNEHRIKAPWPAGGKELKDALLFNELVGLEHVLSKDKVDHQSTNPDGGRGSKDVSDGVCGATFSCLADINAAMTSPDRANGMDWIQSDLARYLSFVEM